MSLWTTVWLLLFTIYSGFCSLSWTNICKWRLVVELKQGQGSLRGQRCIFHIYIATSYILVTIYVYEMWTTPKPTQGGGPKLLFHQAPRPDPSFSRGCRFRSNLLLVVSFFWVLSYSGVWEKRRLGISDNKAGSPSYSLVTEFRWLKPESSPGCLVNKLVFVAGEEFAPSTPPPNGTEHGALLPYACIFLIDSANYFGYSFILLCDPYIIWSTSSS